MERCEVRAGVSVLLVAVLLAVPQVARPADGPAVLARVAEPFRALESFRAEFVREDHWIGMDEPVEYEGTLYLDRPNRFRIEYDEPAGHLQVSDGQKVWTYVPENEQVLLTRLDPSLENRDFLTRILEESEADSTVRRTELDGQVVELLSLDPPLDLELSEVRLWVAAGSDRILQYELIERSGNRSTYRLTKVEENPRLEASLFDFEPPDGVPVVEVGVP